MFLIAVFLMLHLNAIMTSAGDFDKIRNTHGARNFVVIGNTIYTTRGSVIKMSVGDPIPDITAPYSYFISNLSLTMLWKRKNIICPMLFSGPGWMFGSYNFLVRRHGSNNNKYLLGMRVTYI